MSRGMLLGPLGLRSMMNPMPGEADCLPLILGAVGGWLWEELSSKNVFSVASSGRDALHSALSRLTWVWDCLGEQGWHLAASTLTVHWRWGGGWVTFGIILCALCLGLPHWKHYGLLPSARLLFLKWLGAVGLFPGSKTTQNLLSPLE